MVPRSGTCPSLEAAPRGAIALHELFVGAMLIGQVASGKDRAGNGVNQFCGGLGAGKVGAAHDISRPNQGEGVRRFFRSGLRGGFCSCRMIGRRLLSQRNGCAGNYQQRTYKGYPTKSPHPSSWLHVGPRASKIPSGPQNTPECCGYCRHSGRNKHRSKAK